jgi:hypothetical protein
MTRDRTVGLRKSPALSAALRNFEQRQRSIGAEVEILGFQGYPRPE